MCKTSNFLPNTMVIIVEIVIMVEMVIVVEMVIMVAMVSIRYHIILTNYEVKTNTTEMPKLVLFSNFTILSVCLCSLWHFPFSLSKRFFSFPISVLLFPAEEIVYISQCSPPFLLRLYPLLYIKYFLLQTFSSFNSSVFLPFSKKSKDKAEFEKFTFCCYTCLSLNLKDVSEK